MARLLESIQELQDRELIARVKKCLGGSQFVILLPDESTSFARLEGKLKELAWIRRGPVCSFSLRLSLRFFSLCLLGSLLRVFRSCSMCVLRIYPCFPGSFVIVKSEDLKILKVASGSIGYSITRVLYKDDLRELKKRNLW